MTTKINRLDMLIKHYADGKSGAFAEKLDVKPSTISSWKARGTFDIELIFAKCKDINPIWLLSGEGDMLLTTTNNCTTTTEVIYESDPRDVEMIIAKNEMIETQKELIAALKHRIKELERTTAYSTHDAFTSAHSVAPSGASARKTTK